MSERRKAVYASVFDRCVKSESGCLEWTGPMFPDGYGRAGISGRKGLAHRMAYEEARGPIEQGNQIDHLCRNRRCCNPDHLESVAPVVNARRSRRTVHLVNGSFRCAKCGSTDAVAESNPRAFDGFLLRCKPCRQASNAAYRSANAARIKAQRAQHYLNTKAAAAAKGER